MYTKSMMGGEGASTLAVGPRVIPMPALVVWPTLTPGSMTLEASQEIYRAAYESALAVLRPSGYELANRFVPN
jgi:hypothetical protein